MKLMKLKHSLYLVPLLLGGCIYIGHPNDGYNTIPDIHTEAPRSELNPLPRKHEQSSTYLIRTPDDRCLDLSGVNNKDIIAHTCHGKSNQQFTFHNDSIRIQGLCLDVAGNQTQDGAPVIAYQCHGKSNQKWYREGKTIRSSLNGKCLDAGKHKNQIRLYHCDGSSKQRFYISAY
ncbi:lectin [Neisseria sp. 83E34]|uniref:lectin n=1 Tax=Neisseria sp. 83E34 TaxID=1692264 RepID=UPI000AD8C99E|nr:lectin [Neisseria sp. 83E34]